MFDDVDPFIGTAITDLPPSEGLAATWWWPKPAVGNTHPGATYPFGMVSVCPYSGGYPTGYGSYALSTAGLPDTIHDRPVASGFTHFQQSGTGAIRKYYNYFRVSPMLEPLDRLGSTWDLFDEEARPGYYAATLSSGIRCEVTVGPKTAIHRYTFPRHDNARIVVDASIGGLSIPYGATVPLKARLETTAPGTALGEIHVEGVPLATSLSCDAPDWRQLLWYDRRLMPGGSRLDFDYIRPTTLRPFGLMWMGPVEAGQTIELTMGFSLRGPERAERNRLQDCPKGLGFNTRHNRTEKAWRKHLDTIRVADDGADRRAVFATAAYHSMIKPCFAYDESPERSGGPYAFDVCTMWDIYRTQLPLMALLFPERAVELCNSLLAVSEEEGNLPIGYRMAKGADGFSRQGSALIHTLFADLCNLGVPGIDWEWALVHLDMELRRTYGEDYLTRGVAHPISHTLDLSAAYLCTADIAERIGDVQLAKDMRGLAGRWPAAFDPQTGLLVDSTFYEGGRWNYSFRIVPDMAERIAIAGGEERFCSLLDDFFGYGAERVTQPGLVPSETELVTGAKLNRFEGLNNEPDYEAPYSYHYAGRPDRTAEVVHAAIANQFGVGRGGLPGNDDSGGLSSWYVLAALGLFPVAGQNVWLVNAPAYSEATITLPHGELAVTTSGFVTPEPGGPVNYVTSATCDGEPLERSWLSGGKLRRTGHLHLELAQKPADWATTTRPPSRA